MKLYMYASPRGGNGNMGIEFYFKLIPGSPPPPRPLLRPLEMFASVGDAQRFPSVR